MVKVLDSYEVNQDTALIKSAKHFEYQTIVYERGQTLYVKQTPLKIIKNACIEGGASYDGRRQSVTKKIGVQQKVPIPIDPIYNIYACPTASPKQFECSWIFYHHVKTIESITAITDTYRSIITLTNNQQIPMEESFNLLEKQMQRTAYCIMKFSNIHNQEIRKVHYTSVI